MKWNKKTLFIMIISVFAVLLLCITGLSAANKYSEDEKMNKIVKGYVTFVEDGGEKELWGYDKDDKFEDITIGTPIRLSHVEKTKDDKFIINDYDEQFYFVYCRNQLRVGIVMSGEKFHGTTGSTRMFSDYIKTYEDFKKEHPQSSAYRILDFADQYLLMFEDGQTTYLIGEVRQFELPKNQVIKLEEFMLKNQEYFNNYKQNCPALNCYGG